MEKCYELNHLRQFGRKPFIYERRERCTETIHSYHSISQYIEKVIMYFKKENIETNVGIAVNIKEHSVDACVLLLSILNHNCHIYAFNDEVNDNSICDIKNSRVSYVFSKNILKDSDSRWCQMKDLKIILDKYYVTKTFVKFDDLISLSCCYSISTSGSTGVPKMVHVPYECIAPNIKTLSSLFEITSSDIIFIGSPATFDPFMVDLFLALANGAGIVITSKATRFAADNFMHKLLTSRPLIKGATILQITPSLFRLFGLENIRNILLDETSTLRCLILGGEEFPSPNEIFSWLPKDALIASPPKLCKRVFNIYGITEVSCWSCIYEFNISTHFNNQPVPLGSVLDNDLILRIINKDGKVLTDNISEGELQIGSTTRRCYMSSELSLTCEDNPEKVTVFRSTGDLVGRDIKGNIYFRGRLNNIIKRLGKRLYLDMLAFKIKNLLESRGLDNQIVCLWDEDRIQLIFVMNGHHDPTIPQLLKENLNKHEQADKIYYVEELPLTQHGKIDRHQLMKYIKTLTYQKDKSPVAIFEEFLENVLCVQGSFGNLAEEGEWHDKPKRFKGSQNLSFTQVGGSSFQALSLATDIANYLVDSSDQRRILEMLLDSNVPLNEISDFLIKVKYLHKPNICEFQEHLSDASDIKIELMWRADLLKCVDATPTLYQNTVVAVGSHSHLLMVLKVETGEVISRLTLPNRIECPIVFINDQLAAVGCYNGRLYIFDHREGKIRTDIDMGGLVKAKPLLVNHDKLLVASYGEEYNFAAVCLKTYDVKWCSKLGSKGIYAWPIKIDDSVSLACTLDGTCCWVENESGAIKLSRKLVSPIFSTPVILRGSSQNFVVLTEVRGKISVCDINNGNVLNSFQTTGNIFSSMGVHQRDNDNITLVIGCHDRHVYCLNFDTKAISMSLVWKLPFNSPIYATPLILNPPTGTSVLVCGTSGLIKLINLTTAQNTTTVSAVYNLKSKIFFTPCCLSDKYIFVGCRDSFLCAFNLQFQN